MFNTKTSMHTLLKVEALVSNRFFKFYLLQTTMGQALKNSQKKRTTLTGVFVPTSAINCNVLFKGTVQRDFRPPVFFII